MSSLEERAARHLERSRKKTQKRERRLRRKRARACRRHAVSVLGECPSVSELVNTRLPRNALDTWAWEVFYFKSGSLEFVLLYSEAGSRRRRRNRKDRVQLKLLGGYWNGGTLIESLAELAIEVARRRRDPEGLLR